MKPSRSTIEMTYGTLKELPLITLGLLVSGHVGLDTFHFLHDKQKPEAEENYLIDKLLTDHHHQN